MIDQIIQGIKQNSFFIFQSALTAEQLRDLSHFFDQHRSEFKPAMVGSKFHKQRDVTIRGDYTFWLDPLDSKELFQPIMSFLNELQEALNRNFYLGLKQFECHLAFYPPGTFYKKHFDRFELESTRSLSFIFYLNEEWSSDNGGELVLYNKQHEVIQVIYPRPGSFVCFLSDEFPHEVRPGDRERRSLTGWMHTKIIY